MTTTLFALQLGASEFTVGLLMSLFALLPTLLSVSAGRLIDRAGPQRPLLLSLGALTLATALPFAVPRLEILYLSTTLLGVSFMYVHIAMNSVFGAHGSPEQRAPAGEHLPQQAGYGEHVLPMRYRSEHVGFHPFAIRQHSLLVAAGVSYHSAANDDGDSDERA